MRACRRPLLALVVLAVLGLPTPAPGASVGGVSFPTGPRSGGAQYGQPAGRPSAARPVASVFRVAPRALTVGRVPRIALRITQRGVRHVTARVVFRPVHGNGRLVALELGR